MHVTWKQARDVVASNTNFVIFFIGDVDGHVVIVWVLLQSWLGRTFQYYRLFKLRRSLFFFFFFLYRNKGTQQFEAFNRCCWMNFLPSKLWSNIRFHGLHLLVSKTHGAVGRVPCVMSQTHELQNQINLQPVNLHTMYTTQASCIQILGSNLQLWVFVFMLDF